MTETHRALLATIDNAESGLQRVDTALAPKIDALGGTVETLHGEVDRLDAVARQTGEGVGESARAVQEQTQSLQASLREMSAVGAQIDRVFSARMQEMARSQNQIEESMQQRLAELAKSQEDVDAGLEARLHGLQALYEEAQRRQSEYEARLDAFSGTIARTLAQAEGRAREVGAFLSDAASSTAGVLTSQHEELRQSAARERERTVAELTTAYEQTLAQMNELFQHSSERYKGVSQELRAMTSEIQRELEATRQELRRGAVDLPRETGEQAAAMRRVVADQMKALNELTELVTRSGRAYDVAEPAEAPRHEAARHEQPARVESRAPAAPQREPAPRRESWSEPARETPRFDPRPSATRPAAPVPAPTPAPAPARTKEQRGGWMSDLLARASVDEPASSRGAVAPVESLDSLSAEIARVVDENALINAWDRFRRGDRTAFSRRLYTAQGQKTFEDVRQRYAEDNDFRLTVDRYLQEFERLLGEVSRDDRDGLLTRSYLASETGKVYSLLAHASGRLG
jgi:hypothetical protein